MTITDKQVEAGLLARYSARDLGRYSEKTKAFMRGQVRDILEAAEAARDAGDFVLVPREPTEHMREIGGIWARTAAEASERENPTERAICSAVNTWRAMIRAAPSSAEQPAGPCEYCGGSGDVHRADGEWLGECDCTKAKPAPGAPEADALQDRIAQIVFNRFAPDHHVELSDTRYDASYRSTAAEIMALLPAASAAPSVAPHAPTGDSSHGLHDRFAASRVP